MAVQIDRWRQHLEAHQLQLIGTQMQRRPPADGTSGQGPALEIRFYGEWHDARRAFAESDALPPAWTPSSLRMAEPQGGSTRRMWTLVVRVGEAGA